VQGVKAKAIVNQGSLVVVHDSPLFGMNWNVVWSWLWWIVCLNRDQFCKFRPSEPSRLSESCKTSFLSLGRAALSSDLCWSWAIETLA